MRTCPIPTWSMEAMAAAPHTGAQEHSAVHPLFHSHTFPADLPSLQLPPSDHTSNFSIVESDALPVQSLDYEMIENEFVNQDWRARGGIQMIRNLAVENLAGVKFVITSNMMLANKYLAAFTVFTASNFGLTLFATIITAYISPEAAGSGIPEVKAYLNGVDAPRIFSPRTLAVKVVGSIVIVSSSLVVGRAGPMVHTGACIAALLGQCGSKKHGFTYKWLQMFKNDRDRRDLITCGSAAGIAAAFRAPIGGLLFCFEEMVSWWRNALIWKAFFTTAVVAIILRVLIDVCLIGNCGLFGKGGLIMFGVTNANVSYRLKDVPHALLLGLGGGILGSIYNCILERVLRLYNTINNKGGGIRILLACCISLMTSCILFGLPWLSTCHPCPSDALEPCPSIGRSGKYKKFQCPADHYNDLAGLFFNTNDDAIRNLFSKSPTNFQTSTMLLFFSSSFTLSLLSYGIVAPSGLFIPLIMTGASYGRLTATLLGSHSTLDPGLLAVLGSAAFLAGSMRSTLSLSLILLELTNNLLLLPLLMLVLLLSKSVGDLFNSNIYDLIIRLKPLPCLSAQPDPHIANLTVRDVLSTPVCFSGIEKVGNIVRVLKETTHHGFPVVDPPPPEDASRSPLLFGLILRSHLLDLIKRKAFFTRPSRADILPCFSSENFVNNEEELVDVREDEMEMYIDLHHPFTNTCPYTVLDTMSLAKALALFRGLGLRHLLVVPNISSNTQPVIGILTRHDFIKNTFPSTEGPGWKRLWFKQPYILPFWS